MSNPSKPKSEPENITGLAVTDTPRRPTPTHGLGFLGHGTRITLPFSEYLVSHKTGGAYHHIVSSKLADVCKSFRFAQLVQLEYVLLPNKDSASHKWHVDMAWTTADVANITEVSKIIAHPASSRYVQTMATNSIMPVVLPCPLAGVNPIIKDAVPYLDTPKLHCIFTTDEAQYWFADSVIRGVIVVGDPSIN